MADTRLFTVTLAVFFVLLLLSTGYEIEKPYFNYMEKVAHNKTVGNEMGCGPPDDWYCFNSPDAGEMIYMYSSLYQFTGDSIFLDYINNFAGAPVGGPVVSAATCYPSAPTPLCTEGSDHGHALLTYAKAYEVTGNAEYQSRLIEMASQSAEQSAQGDTVGLTYGHNIAYHHMPHSSTGKFMSLPCTNCEDAIYLTKLIFGRYHLYKAGISSALGDMKRLADSGTSGFCGPGQGWLCGTASRQMQHALAYSLVYEESNDQKYLGYVKNLLDEKGKEDNCNAYDGIYRCRTPGGHGLSMMAYMKGYELTSDTTYLNHAESFGIATNDICGPDKKSFMCSDSQEYMGFGYAAVAMLFPAITDVTLSHERPTIDDTVTFSATVFDPPKKLDLDPFGAIDLETNHGLSQGITSCVCYADDQVVDGNCYNINSKKASFSKSFSEGKHTLKIQCTNVAGKTNTVTEEIIAYASGIGLTINSISSPTTKNEFNITADYNSAEAITCQIRIVGDSTNQNWVDMDGDEGYDGIVHKYVTVSSEGDLEVEITCTSSVAEKTASITFVRDVTPPDFLSGMPSWTNSENIFFGIQQINDAYTDVVLCNATFEENLLLEKTPGNQKVSWEKTVSSGKHEITFCCADVLGNSVCKEFDTGVDVQPPFFETQLSFTTDTEVEFTISNVRDLLSGMDICYVDVNDVFFGQNVFNSDVTAANWAISVESETKITACCNDNAGNSYCSTKNVKPESNVSVTLMPDATPTPIPTQMARTTPVAIPTEDPMPTPTLMPSGYPAPTIINPIVSSTPEVSDVETETTPEPTLIIFITYVPRATMVPVTTQIPVVTNIPMPTEIIDEQTQEPVVTYIPQVTSIPQATVIYQATVMPQVTEIIITPAPQSIIATPVPEIVVTEPAPEMSAVPVVPVDDNEEARVTKEAESIADVTEIPSTPTKEAEKIDETLVTLPPKTSESAVEVSLTGDIGDDDTDTLEPKATPRYKVEAKEAVTQDMLDKSFQEAKLAIEESERQGKDVTQAKEWLQIALDKRDHQNNDVALSYAFNAMASAQEEIGVTPKPFDFIEISNYESDFSEVYKRVGIVALITVMLIGFVLKTTGGTRVKVSPELKKYIKEMQNDGFEEGEIIEQLIKANYEEAEIYAAFGVNIVSEKKPMRKKSNIAKDDIDEDFDEEFSDDEKSKNIEKTNASRPVSPDLQNYVDSMKNKGYSLKEIRKALKGAGYKEEEIENVLLK